MIATSLIIAATIIIVDAATVKRLSRIDKCRILPQPQDEANECLRVTLEESLRYNEEDSLDPLRIDEIVLNEGGRHAIELAFALRDINVEGLKESRIERVTVQNSDSDNVTLDIKAFTRRLQMTGKYDMSPMEKNGPFNISLEGIKTNLKLSAQPSEGRLKINNLDLNLDITRMRTHICCYFNDDQLLNTEFNKLIDRNWEEGWNELRPFITKAYGDALERFCKRLFESVIIKNTYRTLWNT